MSLQLGSELFAPRVGSKNPSQPKETKKSTSKRSIADYQETKIVSIADYSPELIEYSTDDYSKNLKTIYETQPIEKLMEIFEAKKTIYHNQKKQLSYSDLRQISPTRWKMLEELRVLRYVIKKREGIELEIFE